MGELPPPTVQPDKGAPNKGRGILIIGSALVVLAIIGIAFGSREDDEPAEPTDRELAQLSWDELALDEQAAMCDGFRFAGEAFTVDNMLIESEQDERTARAWLDVIRDEC